MDARKPRIAGRDFEKNCCGFLEDSVPELKAEEIIVDILWAEYLNVHKNGNCNLLG